MRERNRNELGMGRRGVAEDKSMCSHVMEGPATHKRILDFILRASGGHCRIASMTTWGQVHWIRSALLLSHFMLGTQYLGSWSSVLRSSLFLFSASLSPVPEERRAYILECWRGRGTHHTFRNAWSLALVPEFMYHLFPSLPF